jgi:hypothetical protein
VDDNSPLRSVRWFTRSSGSSKSSGTGSGSNATPLGNGVGPGGSGSPGADSSTPQGILHHTQPRSHPHGQHAHRSVDAVPFSSAYTNSSPPAGPNGATTSSPTNVPAHESHAASPTHGTAAATPRGVTFAADGTAHKSPPINDVPTQAQGSPTSAEVPAPPLSAKQRPFSEHPRPPRINTHPSGQGGDTFPGTPMSYTEEARQQGQEGYPSDNSAHKVYYLTYSFYAPWIHTSHMNVRRAVSYTNRTKAQKYGDKYHLKYSLNGDGGRPRSGTEDTVSTVNEGFSKDSNDGKVAAADADYFYFQNFSRVLSAFSAPTFVCSYLHARNESFHDSHRGARRV